MLGALYLGRLQMAHRGRRIPQGPKETAFIFTIATTSQAEVFTIPCQNAGLFDAVVEWGDGSTSTVKAYNDANLAHAYQSPGVHKIRITGIFPSIYFSNSSEDAAKVKSVENLGHVSWLNLSRAFSNCATMTKFVVGNTDTSFVLSMSYMFQSCYGLKTIDLEGLDTSSALTLSGMFSNCFALKTLDVTGLSTSSAVSLSSMFSGCVGLTDIFGVEDFDLRKLNSASSLRYFMASVTLPVARYDSILIAWDAKSYIRNGISIHFGNSKYTAASAAAAAHDRFTNIRKWVIADKGPV